ncbi:MAG: peptidyl-prolyl cis-trans isomerase [Methylophilaceae bacterium]|nr:peptidyl-prolyl cis-trans isomerase [Methylophilaceae bacterium]
MTLKNTVSKLLLGILLLGVISVSAAADLPRVEIETNQGNITLELYPEKAPKTVANFLQYVNADFYKGTIFHRVINNFMIQGGGFTRDMMEKPTNAPIVNEANDGLLNELGTIAMARTNEPDSATAQFFINLTNNQFLNHVYPSPEQMGYCVFGKVINGLDVVKKIGLTPTLTIGGFADVPVKAVIIKSIEVINGGSTLPTPK